MTQPTSQADHLKLWQLRLGAMEANAAELQDLEPGRQKLQAIVNGAQSAFQVQFSATAARQESSRTLETLVSEGRLVMAYLNAGLKEHYGKDSEKLIEFGIQPFRGQRPKPAKPEPPPPPPPLPEDVL
jgi:uncharacterized protein (DUF2336 family)